MSFTVDPTLQSGGVSSASASSASGDAIGKAISDADSVGSSASDLAAIDDANSDENFPSHTYAIAACNGSL